MRFKITFTLLLLFFFSHEKSRVIKFWLFLRETLLLLPRMTARFENKFNRKLLVGKQKSKINFPASYFPKFRLFFFTFKCFGDIVFSENTNCGLGPKFPTSCLPIFISILLQSINVVWLMRTDNIQKNSGCVSLKKAINNGVFSLHLKPSDRILLYRTSTDSAACNLEGPVSAEHTYWPIFISHTQGVWKDQVRSSFRV